MTLDAEITHAKRDLIVTWNSGRQGDATPSLVLSELMRWWKKCPHQFEIICFMGNCV